MGNGGWGFLENSRAAIVEIKEAKGETTRCRRQEQPCRKIGKQLMGRVVTVGKKMNEGRGKHGDGGNKNKG